MAMNMIWDLECDEDFMDYVEIDLSDPVDPQDLLPGLPEEIAMECLLRVSHTAFPQLQGVCKRWGELVTAQSFYAERKRVGTTQNCMCIVQALPESNHASPGGKHSYQSAPVFGLSVYDARNRSWSWLPPIPDFPVGLPVFCRVVGLNDKLVLIGGWQPTSYEALRNVYMFNFSTQTWKRCADMPRSRSFFACGVIGNRVYVAGGHDDNKNGLASADVYSPEEDRWEAIPDMSEERDECGGVVVENGTKLAIISGYSTTSQGQFVGSAEIYDPQVGCWTRVENMWKEGVSPGPFVMTQQNGGQLYAIQRDALVRYCSRTNVWTVVDSLPQDDRVATCATAICDDLILMTLPSSGDPMQSLVHRRPLECEGIGKWELVQRDDEFHGIGRAACAVEV
ncbi:unnamed protein product [Calypogeia fissa]